MKDLVEVIAKALVEHPEDVIVREEQDEKGTRIDLLVDPSDMGKVIGRQGRIAKAIRTVVKAAAIRDDVVVDVNIDSNAEETETAAAEESEKAAAEPDSADEEAAPAGDSE